MAAHQWYPVLAYIIIIKGVIILVLSTEESTVKGYS